jgi:hypothetical protein
MTFSAPLADGFARWLRYANGLISGPSIHPFDGMASSATDFRIYIDLLVLLDAS